MDWPKLIGGRGLFCHQNSAAESITKKMGCRVFLVSQTNVAMMHAIFLGG
jgi:hypothetical protein